MLCSSPLYKIPASVCRQFPSSDIIGYFDPKNGKVIGQAHYQSLLSFFPGLDGYVKKIGCGQCVCCRLNHSKEWANRVVLESMAYKDNLFVTLTYSDEEYSKLRRVVVDPRPGIGEVFRAEGTKASDDAELNKGHAQKFMKDFRAYCQYHYNWTGIRFFMCGEYGTQFARPHFHFILMNVPPELKLVYRYNSLGVDHFTCTEIRQIWGRGFDDVTLHDWKAAAYTARYCVKKAEFVNPKNLKDIKLYSEEHDQIVHRARCYDPDYDPDAELINWQPFQPSFINMSRMPGIARVFFDENFEKIYEHDSIIKQFRSDRNAEKIKPFVYYDRLYDEMHKHGSEFPSRETYQLKCLREQSGIKYSEALASTLSCSLEQYEKAAVQRQERAVDKLIRSL